MPWKKRINDALAKTTGYQLERTTPRPAAKAGGGRRRRKVRKADRLVRAPVFVMCTLRSGSTLLRVLLNSHSKIHSPQELHLRDLAVRVKTDYASKALGEIGLDDEQMRFLLWDRLLQRELAAAGKEILVNKTPNDVFIADLIARCWPDARFIYLLRHPGSIARSRQRPARRTPPSATRGWCCATATRSRRPAQPGPA